MEIEFPKSLIQAVDEEHMKFISSKPIVSTYLTSNGLIVYLEDNNILNIETEIVLDHELSHTLGCGLNGKRIICIYGIVYDYGKYSMLSIEIVDALPINLVFCKTLKFYMNRMLLNPIDYYVIDSLIIKVFSSSLGEKILLRTQKIGAKHILYFDDKTELIINYTDCDALCDSYISTDVPENTKIHLIKETRYATNQIQHLSKALIIKPLYSEMIYIRLNDNLLPIGIYPAPNIWHEIPPPRTNITPKQEQEQEQEPEPINRIEVKTEYTLGG